MKITKIVCVSVLISMLLCSCGNVNNKTSTAGNSSEIETSENGIQSYDRVADDFLTKLKNGDSEELSNLTFARSKEVFDFIKTVKIDDFKYEIIDISTENDAIVNYKVNLSISKSDSDIFPVGESEWILNLRFGAGNTIQFFKPINSNIDLSWDNGSKEAILAYNFSRLFKHFKTCSNFNEIVPSVDNQDFYNDFIFNCAISYLQFTQSSDYSVKNVSDYMNSKYGINSVDFKKYEYYDEVNDYISIPGRGGSWDFSSLVSEEFNTETNCKRIIIDYYADCALLVKAKTMKYVVEGNSDENYKLLSTELIYDSGFTPANGSV